MTAVSLRSLLSEPEILVMPGAYDALTARLAERAGFRAIYLTGSGVSYSSLAKPDLGYTGLSDMISAAWRITGAVSVPVLADGDTGYGNALNVVNTVREYERAGLAGIQLEDQSYPKRCGHYLGRQLIEATEMANKIKAACDARRDGRFVIVARTDARTGFGLQPAIERALMYEEAGADVVFVESLESIDEMRSVNTALSTPTMANMVEGGRTPLLSAAELQELGYRLVIFPNAISRTMAFAVTEMLDVLKRDGTTRGCLDRMLDFEAICELVGLPQALALEQRYAPAMPGQPK